MRPKTFNLFGRKSHNPLRVLMAGYSHTQPVWKRYGYAILSVACALIVSITFRELFDPNPFLLFFGAVSFSAWYGGLRPGLLSVILTVLLVNYYFLSPDVLDISTNDLIRMSIFAAIAATFSMLHYLDVLRIQEQTAFQVTLSSIGDGVIVTDTQSQIVYLNEKGESLTGWSKDEANGKRLQEVFRIFDEDSHQPVANPIQSVFKEKRVVGLANHTVLKTRDGREIPISDSGSPIRMADGEVMGAVLVFRDVVQERASARALRESENRFRTVADTAPVMIWMSDTDKLRGYFNQPWLGFTGRMLEQELGNGWTDSLHPNDVKHCMDTYAASFDRQEHFTMEYRLRRHDGVYRWVLDSGLPRYDADGHFIGYIGSCIDITDRKRSETLLGTLQSITAALAGAATSEDVAEVIVTKALTVFGGSIASVAMLSADGTQANVIRRKGAPEEFDRDFMSMDIDSNYPIVESIREQKTIWLENVEAYLEAYPHLADIRTKTGTQAAVCLPLVIDDKTIGALGLAFKAPVEFTSTERGFMTALAQHCAQAMERAQLSERARAGAAIEERHQLAHDLHDSISQSLFAITMTAETLPQTWHKKPEAVPQHLERLLLLGRGAHAAMRAMLLELRPDQLAAGSISDQFEQLAAMLIGRKNIKVSLQISPDIDQPRLPIDVHEALYRISQEALNHIITHSTASRVDVQLMKEAGAVKLLIQDDGKPSSPDETVTPILAMPTMRERAEKIGAEFTFTSTPAHGAALSVEWRPED